jgi:hypothetical protein
LLTVILKNIKFDIKVIILTAIFVVYHNQLYKEMISLAVQSAGNIKGGGFWCYISCYLISLKLLICTLTPPIFSIYAIRFDLNSPSFGIIY